MPVPTNLSDLSQTPASNSPASTDTLSTADDYLRAQASILAKISAGTNALVSPSITTLSVTGNTTLGDATSDTVQVNGTMGVGGAANTSIAVMAQNTALSGASQEGFRASITGTSGATTAVRGVYARPTTAAAVFTVADLSGFYAANPTKGAGSTITNQHGVYVEDQTQGTNNYGITSLVSSGANKWNIYASGTAANYFAGNVDIGQISASAGSPSLKLRRGRDDLVDAAGIADITFAAGTADTAVARINAIASGTLENAAHLTFSTSTGGSLTERLRIDSAGNVGINTTLPETTLTINKNDANGIVVRSADTNGSTLDYGVSTTNGYTYLASSRRGTGTYQPLTFWTSGIERLRIDSAGNQFSTQAAPAAVNTTATLTTANLATRIVTSTTAAAVVGTLPTGTLMDGWYAGNTDMAIDWSVINTGATNTFTVAAGTGHTVVGNMVVAVSSSGSFRSRRTAANTWITYRVG